MEDLDDDDDCDNMGQEDEEEEGEESELINGEEEFEEESESPCQERNGRMSMGDMRHLEQRIHQHKHVQGKRARDNEMMMQLIMSNMMIERENYIEEQEQLMLQRAIEESKREAPEDSNNPNVD